VDFENADKLHAVIITAGKIVSEAFCAKDILKEIGVNVGIILLEYIKPYDKIAEEIVKRLPEKHCKIILLEEEIRSGGMGMNLLDKLDKYEISKNKSITIMALDDNFAIQNKNESIYKTANISAEDIVENIAKGLIEQKMNPQIYK
jgi:deoxyxylulose-5-phosphate synthase